jgi:hypothetical protein
MPTLKKHTWKQLWLNYDAHFYSLLYEFRFHQILIIRVRPYLTTIMVSTGHSAKLGSISHNSKLMPFRTKIKVSGVGQHRFQWFLLTPGLK